MVYRLIHHRTNLLPRPEKIIKWRVIVAARCFVDFLIDPVTVKKFSILPFLLYDKNYDRTYTYIYCHYCYGWIVKACEPSLTTRRLKNDWCILRICRSVTPNIYTRGYSRKYSNVKRCTACKVSQKLGTRFSSSVPVAGSRYIFCCTRILSSAL